MYVWQPHLLLSVLNVGQSSSQYDLFSLEELLTHICLGAQRRGSLGAPASLRLPFTPA